MGKALAWILVLVFAGPAFAGAGDHHFALFGGVTKHGSKTYSVVGADYEYGVTDWLGLGVTGENVSTDPGTTIGLAMASLYPLLGLRLFAGVGQESAGGHSESITRVGAAYTLQLGPLSLTPMLAHDSNASGGSSDTFGLSLGLHL